MPQYNNCLLLACAGVPFNFSSLHSLHDYHSCLVLLIPCCCIMSHMSLPVQWIYTLLVMYSFFFEFIMDIFICLYRGIFTYFCILVIVCLFCLPRYCEICHSISLPMSYHGAMCPWAAIFPLHCYSWPSRLNYRPFVSILVHISILLHFY